MRIRRWILAVTLCVLAFSCGGSDGGSTPTAPTGERRVIFSRTDSLTPGNLFTISFRAGRPGTVEVTVDWTDPNNEIWVHLVDAQNADCQASQFVACFEGGACPCNFLFRSEAATPKPKFISIPTSRTAIQPETFALLRLFVSNLGPGDESVSYGAVLVQ